MQDNNSKSFICPHCSVTLPVTSRNVKSKEFLVESLVPGVQGSKRITVGMEKCANCKMSSLISYDTSADNKKPVKLGTPQQEAPAILEDSRPKPNQGIHFIYPRNCSARTIQGLPEPYATDYKEAQLTLEVSPRASAALSRLCLQKLLENEAKIAPANLNKQISEVLEKNLLPGYITQYVDQLRKYDSISNQSEDSPGDIHQADHNEASVMILMLEVLFDHFIIAPKKFAQTQQTLEEKLSS